MNKLLLLLSISLNFLMFFAPKAFGIDGTPIAPKPSADPVTSVFERHYRKSNESNNPLKQRFQLVGIIAANEGAPRKEGIAVLKDTYSKKTLVVRVGQPVPFHPNLTVLTVKKKTVVLSDGSEPVEITSQGFDGYHDGVESNIARNNNRIFPSDAEDEAIPMPQDEGFNEPPFRPRYQPPRPMAEDEGSMRRPNFRNNRRFDRDDEAPRDIPPPPPVPVPNDDFFDEEFD